MSLFQSLLIFLSFVAIKDVSPYYTDNYFVDKINDLRRTYAKKYNVPNMHRLMWSEDLVNILDRLDWSVAWPEARITWRYTALKFYETSQIETDVIDFLKKTPEEKSKTIKTDAKSSMKGMELFNPLQRFIGCYPKREGNSSFPVCLVGTEGSFTMFDTTGQSTGIPGSECHKRYKNEGGLCVPNNEDEESYYGHLEDIIESVNQIREDYSREFNVPNMHQLVRDIFSTARNNFFQIWSDDLLKNLQNMNRDNGFKGACVTWRYVHIDTSNKGSIKKELSSTFFEKSDVEKRSFVSINSHKTLESLEFLNPLQKFIACSRNSNTRFICLLGTEGKFTMFDYSHKSSETPGSNCHKRYRNDSGICVAIKPEEESYFGRQSDFMSDINEIRRRYAKEYRVSNMHALTWSNELAEVLDPLDTTGVRAKAKETWRYGALNTYDNTIYHIKADVTRFFEMNRTAKNDHIVKTLSDKDTMDRLEFLNPLQKTIACGRKEEEGVTYIICLLGPEGNFTIFDTSFQSQLAAGSKCHKGYYNEDGLCIMQIPTQVPIIDYRKMAEEERNKALTEEPEPEPILENHGNEISLGYLLVFLLAKLFFNI
ncbi:hypothetical protein CRE_14478 [Caenorhabditis remanei]|uniref:SCP domain-containing protein n=1 Tax=Caenorhabditis remanei TaxID=31234 RepID=E3M953_CAERE|nr:hypothetical protein CRE_14478 [Caenorhabditis remanei]